MKKLTIGLLGLGLAVSLSACGGKGGGKSILVYSAYEDDQYPELIEAFKAEHPDIEVTISRASTGVIMSKAIAEKDNPQADVLWGIAGTELLAGKEAGLLAPYAPKGVAGLDARFKDSDEKPAWVGLDVFMTALCVNTEELKAKNLPMPKSLADLTNPVYKGQIVMPNPNSSGTGFMAISTILQTMGEEAGWAYLDELHKNVAQYVHSGSQPCKMAGSGEYAIGMSFDYRAFKQKSEGQPLEVVFPSEGSGWEIETAALVKKKEIKPEAKIFMDWAISEKAMAGYSKFAAVLARPGQMSSLPGYPPNPEKQLGKNDLAWATEHKKRITDEWAKRYDGKSAAKD